MFYFCHNEDISKHIKIQLLVDNLEDERKAGGAYIKMTGTVKMWLIAIQSGTKILMNDILNIEGEIFVSLQ